MTEPKEPRNINSIRAMGESDRSPEHKQIRDEFVAASNQLLDTVKTLQEQGDMIQLAGGLTLPIQEKPRISEEIIARGRVVSTVAVHKEPGISLHGDGDFSPLTLQVVIPDTGGSLMVELTGTNPMLPNYMERNYSLRNQGSDYASLKISGVVVDDDKVLDVPEQRFQVNGDGSVAASAPLELGQHLGYNERAILGMQNGLSAIDRLREVLNLPQTTLTD